LFSLHDAAEAIRKAESTRNVQPSILATEGHESQRREGWQNRACDLLCTCNPSGALRRHLRRRLDRWRVEVLPGHRVERIIKVLRTLAASTPPRVWACMFRTVCNGWTSSRRFQKAGFCLLGCRCEDSIEHYARCPVANHWFEKYAGLKSESPNNKLGLFLGLSLSGSQLAPILRGGDEAATAATLLGLAVYALYKCILGVRHGNLSRDAAEDAFCSWIQSAAETNGTARSLLQRARRRPRSP